MDSPNLNRRSSVFSDLLTVFRKNTGFSLPRRSIYHAPPINRTSLENSYQNALLTNAEPLKEADAFNEGDENEEDEDEEKKSGKPMTRQSLLNKIRQKKEVINKLRCQPWSMNRKRRTLRLAQKYLEQNESKVSRAHLYKEEFIKRWHSFLRWASNISIYLIPWESKIKKIESQFGSVVSSYFTFLRWVIFMNFILTIIIASLIVIPELLADATADSMRRNRTFTRKEIPAEEKPHADEIQVVWHYGGYLRYSPLFYGYYANADFIGEYFRYPIPLAYFIGTLVVFACSFIAILRKMAFNARMSKLAGSKTEQYIFNWKVFTGWDYTIGNTETASNTAMAAVIKLRETINECHAEESKKIRPIQVVIRIITNIVIFGMIAFSIYCIYAAVQSSEAVEQTGSGSLLTKNQELDEGVLFPKSSMVPSVVSTITHVFPIIFDLIGKIEKHHPKMQLRLHLFRVLTLYVINYATLIFALFEKLDNIRDITRTFDEEDKSYSYSTRVPRHLAKLQTQIPSSSEFSSRNFLNESHLRSFLNGRQSSGVHTSAAVPSTLRKILPKKDIRFVTPALPQPDVRPGSAITQRRYAFTAGTHQLHEAWSRRKRQTEEFSETISLRTLSSSGSSTSTKPRWRSTVTAPSPRFSAVTNAANDASSSNVVTVDGSRVMINAQFGPVGVNNPNALMRNATASPALTSYETRRLGPTPLPVYTPPPLPPTESQPIFRKHDFGPDWSISIKEKTESPAISFGDVVKLDTIPYSELNEKGLTSAEDESDYNSSTVAVISSEVGDQGHYNDHICWETVIGQEIVKLVTMDLYYTIVSILVIDFFRGYWIRYCSSWWCWDIETTFPEYGEFKVAENVLHIINNQGMIWLGLFFAPLLPAVNNVKLIIIMYIRAWACMTCNVPAREIFRASRSSNFFLMILLLWLLLCTLPVGYVITSKRPSTICGPFAGKDQFYKVITEIIEAHVSKKVIRWLKYVASPGVIIPIILLLMLIIFFLVSLVRGLREANTDLQKQLVHERTEEKKKIFELAGGGKQKKPSASFFGITAKLQPKKPSQYIPDVERKRREPWRQYNGTDRASSLCPSDEQVSSPLSESCTSPPPPVSASRLPQVQTRSTLPRNAMSELSAPPKNSYAFRPSLGSLEEGESNSAKSSTPAGNEQSTKWSNTNRCVKNTATAAPNNNVKMSKSGSVARSALTDRLDDYWFNENEATHSENSYNNGIEEGGDQPPSKRAVGTPDDVRSLILPFLETRKFHSGESIISLAAFPKDANNPIIFGTCIGSAGSGGGASGGGTSRRSSAANKSATSCASLYENNSPNTTIVPPPASEELGHTVNSIASTNIDKPYSAEYSEVSSTSGALTQWNPRYSRVWRHQYSTAAALPPRPPPSSSSSSSINQQLGVATIQRMSRSETSGTSMSRSGTFPSGSGSVNNSADTTALAAAAAMARSFAFHPQGASKLPPGGLPATEAQQRISIYAKEPRRVGQQTKLGGPQINTSVNVHNQNPSTSNQRQINNRQSQDTVIEALHLPTRRNERTERPKAPKPSDAPGTSNLSPNVPSTSSQKPETSKSSIKPPSGSGKTFNATDLTDQFVPWPTIEEVKAQRSKLFNTQKSKATVQSRRSRSPTKVMTKSEYTPTSQKEQPASTSALSDTEQEVPQPTRFRISVSPTRKLRPGPDSSESSDDDEVNKTATAYRRNAKPRYVIKQQLMPGSTSSFGSRISTETTTAAVKAELVAAATARMAAATASASNSRRQAPKVEFGDDDSPRVETSPKIS